MLLKYFIYPFPKKVKTDVMDHSNTIQILFLQAFEEKGNYYFLFIRWRLSYTSMPVILGTVCHFRNSSVDFHFFQNMLGELWLTQNACGKINYQHREKLLPCCPFLSLPWFLKVRGSFRNDYFNVEHSAEPCPSLFSWGNMGPFILSIDSLCSL